MSLGFIVGPSGSGKSTTLYRNILNEAKREPDKRFFILVPDQFTMETQRTLCKMSESGGIMNVEVMSFGRLSHRIFEELGIEDLPKLDDTGKNLVLRKVAADHADELSIMGDKINRMGYISGVKSMISEFAQYGLSPESIENIGTKLNNRGRLQEKLKDLSILYKGYKEYIQGNYITIEENIDILIASISKSDILKGSVIGLDGFTGFTPIQEILLKELMIYTERVIVTLTADKKEDLDDVKKEHALFYLSAKTYLNLNKIAKENAIKRNEDIFLSDVPVKRFKDNKVLSHLERNIFRMRTKKEDKSHICDLDTKDIISVSSLPGRKEECEWVCMQIRRLIREKGYAYRDFALICADLPSYDHFLREAFDKHDIPLFLDRNASLLQHPFIVFILGLMGVYNGDFSYDSVMGLIRTGFLPFTDEEADLFSDYIKTYGIRGKKRYERMFVLGASAKGEGEKDIRAEADKLRQRLMDILKPLTEAKKDARSYTKALYEICLKAKADERLYEIADEWSGQNDPDRAKECEQVYAAVIGLFDQIYALLDEKMDAKEYTEILKAGFSELKVGSLPQSVDRVVIGDLERTRLKAVKTLFIIGVNDGIIPKNTTEGGLLSELERYLLKEAGVTLKPTPREKSFEERLYIYMNMTKPSDSLFISCSEKDSAGKSLRPSYLCRSVTELYSKLETEVISKEDEFFFIETRERAKDITSALLRDYVSYNGSCDEKRMEMLLLLASGMDEEFIDKEIKAAFISYEPIPLPEKKAALLYGEKLHTSVTRLELFSKCAYAYFVRYGLRLNGDEEYEFNAMDLGNLYHGILAGYGEMLKEKGLSWGSLSEEETDGYLETALNEFASAYKDSILYDTKRSETFIRRAKDILKRTIKVLSYQVESGGFKPVTFEGEFEGGNKTKIHGRIDRLDIAEKDNKRYIKIIDYKSGDISFSPTDLLYGTNLQLPVYLDAACRNEESSSGKLAIPAALFYYRVNDPIIECGPGESNEEIAKKITSECRVKGLIRGDEEVINLLTGDLSSCESDVCHIKRKKDGSFTANSDVTDPETFDLYLKYASLKTDLIGKDILGGNISVLPLEKGKRNACEYCEYKGMCGFDKNIPGYRYDKVSADDEAAAKEMKKIVEENEA